MKIVLRSRFTPALAITAVAFTQSVFAQQEQTDQTPQPPGTTLDRVEITGSNIPRAVSETTENIQIITSQEIEHSGQSTVADYLHTISSNFASFNETFTNSFAPGASGVALRGLSQKNTLVLLNGRRIANYGFAQNLEDTFVDLNVIPLSAVQRIEVLKSGAAAIYGSDATAGVVNIILKQNSTERIADAGVSATSHGGAGSRDASLAMGFGDFATDNYNVFVTGGVFKRDDLAAAQRPFTQAQDFSDKPDGFSVWLPTNSYTSNANPTAPQTAFPTCGRNGQPGQVVNLATLPETGGSGTACAYNPASQLSLIPGTERANLTATGNLKLGANWTAFGDAFYSNVKTTSLFTPANLSATSIAYNPTTGGVSSVPNTLPVGNPSNPTAAPQDINYLFQSVGGRNYDVYSNTYRVSGGVKGTFANWDWEAAYGHSENHVTQRNYNSINVGALGTAITDGTYDFLDPTPAQSASIRSDWDDKSTSRLDTVGFKGNGSLATLPAGSLDAAFGAEFRHESTINIPSQLQLSGQILNYGLAEVDGGRSVYAAFAELNVPILKGLEADLAAREEHYSDVGGNFSPQVSVRWQPVNMLTMRAVASKGFRAPSLPEISHATSTSFVTVTDPSDPLLRASETVGEVTSANPKLRPETSDNIDLGFVLSPTANYDLSVDYYHIQVNHVIATEAAPQTIVDDPAAYPGQISRTGSGLLNYISVPYENKYQISTSGFDITGDLIFHLPAGARFRINASATYVSHLEVNDGTNWTDYAGSNGWLYNSPISGGGPVPRWRGSVTGAWENPSWLGQLTVRYIGSYSNVCFEDNACGPEASQVSANTILDLYGEYTGVKNWKFSASVLNVLNTTPPWDWFAFVAFGTPYDPTLYDGRGRTFEVRAQYRF
jgi:iron complex outermembrane receptor protein